MHTLTIKCLFFLDLSIKIYDYRCLQHFKYYLVKSVMSVKSVIRKSEEPQKGQERACFFLCRGKNFFLPRELILAVWSAGLYGLYKVMCYIAVEIGFGEGYRAVALAKHKLPISLYIFDKSFVYGHPRGVLSVLYCHLSNM